MQTRVIWMFLIAQSILRLIIGNDDKPGVRPQ